MGEAKLSIEQIANFMNAGDILTIEKHFNYAADWNTREWLALALRDMVSKKLSFDIEVMKEALCGVIELCEAEVGGEAYRTNCIRFANNALKELETSDYIEQRKLKHDQLEKDKELEFGRLIADLKRGRLDAAEALCEIGDARAVEPFIEALKYEWIRPEAAEALGKIGDKRAVEPLIVALKDKSKSVRNNAAEALGKIGDPRAVEPLIVAMNDQEEYIRNIAFKALIKLGNLAVEPLIDMLRGKNKNFRKKSLKVLSMIKTQRAVEPIIRLIKEKVKRRIPFYTTWDECVALSMIGKPAVEQIIAVLNDNDMKQKSFLIETLGNIGDKRAVEPLIVALKDKSKSVRNNAAEALGKIGDPRAVEPLIAALKDKFSEVGANAALALGKIGDPRAVEALHSVIKKRNSSINAHNAAAKAISKISGEVILLKSGGETYDDF